MADYLVVVTRHSGCWVASVCGMPGAQTWGESIEQLHIHVRETIILRTGRPVAELGDLESFNITYRLYEDERERLAALGDPSSVKEGAPVMARIEAECCIPWDQARNREQQLWRQIDS